MFFNKNKNKDISEDKITVDVSTITTIIGKDTVFEGTLTSDASVRINGAVIGDVRVKGVVILSATGRIEGTIEAESIIVAGKVEGNMSIRDKVNVEPSGQIYGEIITKKFVIDEESVFEGNCVMNRDGKVIPATPYKKKGEEVEESKEEKPEEKAEEKTDEKTSEKKEEKTDKAEESEDEKEEKKAEEKSEDKPEEKSDSEEAESKEEKTEEPEEEKDSHIIIADINEIKDGDDVPTTEYIDSAEVKDGNFRKTSKSLSVEVE